METGFSGPASFEGVGRGGYFRGGRNRVLLREPERCPECNRVFLSLYPLRSCSDHEGLDEV